VTDHLIRHATGTAGHWDGSRLSQARVSPDPNRPSPSCTCRPCWPSRARSTPAPTDHADPRNTKAPVPLFRATYRNKGQ